MLQVSRTSTIWHTMFRCLFPTTMFPITNRANTKRMCISPLRRRSDYNVFIYQNFVYLQSSRASFLVESINRDNEMEHRPLEIEHHVPPAPHYNAYDTRRSTGASEQSSHISEESIPIGHTGSAGELVPNLAGPKVFRNLLRNKIKQN